MLLLLTETAINLEIIKRVPYQRTGEVKTAGARQRQYCFCNSYSTAVKFLEDIPLLMYYHKPPQIASSPIK